MARTSNSILIGHAADLPDPTPDAGESFQMTAVHPDSTISAERIEQAALTMMEATGRLRNNLQGEQAARFKEFSSQIIEREFERAFHRKLKEKSDRGA
ncbi:hypothetical protein [Rhizobium sp. YTU87027]|uniref:hypothetical protein n=1 Tax=Rhizobium sp. YTU87027 TaxID=3417741 RepID=UPI003D69D994